MNPELQRQHDAAQARRARINAGPPKCRAIPIAAVTEPAKRPRRISERRSNTAPARQAIEHEHQVRVQCVRASYEAERDRHRAVFKHMIEDCRKREIEDMEELARYRIELLREIGL